MEARNLFPAERDTRFWSRSYQRPFMGAFARQEFDRFYKVWHRQAGKDDCDFNTITQHLTRLDTAGSIGNYAYIFPEFEHGKRALWEKVCAHNIRLIEHVPEEARAGKRWLNEGSMQLWLRNGTSLQVFGARYPDKLRGPSFKGVAISEASRCNPGILNVVTPMLEENHGWLALNTTPNGKGWSYDLWRTAEKDARWWTELLTVAETRRDAQGEQRYGEPVFGPRELQAERDRGMSEDWIRQEYYCSWNAPMDGSVHGRLMEVAWREKRIGLVPWEPQLQVHTWWDLGNTAVIFQQSTGREVLIIDYLFVGGHTLQEIVPMLFQGDRGRYRYGGHHFPFDMRVTDYTAADGRSRIETAELLLGKELCHVGGNATIPDRINAAQQILPSCRIDETKAADLIKALESYHYEYNEDRQNFKSKPEKDWASHGADAFAEMALHVRKEVPPERPRRPAAMTPRQYGGGDWQH